MEQSHPLENIECTRNANYCVWDGLAMPWMGRYPDLIEVRYDGSIRDLLTFLGTLAQDGLQWRQVVNEMQRELRGHYQAVYV